MTEWWRRDAELREWMKEAKAWRAHKREQAARDPLIQRGYVRRGEFPESWRIDSYGPVNVMVKAIELTYDAGRVMGDEQPPRRLRYKDPSHLVMDASWLIWDAGYQLQDMPPPEGEERIRLLTRLDKARWAIARVAEDVEQRVSDTPPEWTRTATAERLRDGLGTELAEYVQASDLSHLRGAVEQYRDLLRKVTALIGASN